MTDREIAMKWWKSIGASKRLELAWAISRTPENLTGREIQKIWEALK